MPVVKCKGVNIEFPFDPYDCQKDYMSRVVECLQSGKNGILESPTGTGKTLCLLCSTLAWRNTYISQQELGRCLQGDNGAGLGEEEGGFRQKLAAELKEGATGTWGDAQEGMFVDRPRIIYASRTHSQLSQAVDQLKGTAYRPRVAVIGSRDQLCIHPEVQKTESNSAKVHMCKAKVDRRMCNFYNSLDQKKADRAFTDSILDIEDLVRLGNSHKVCPYYMARELKANADIIFMPYNYLLDSKARRIHGVELQGNVVIFDEAHNVEKMCEESASFDLTSFDLASCVEETDHLLKKTVEVEMCNQQFRTDSEGGGGDFDASALATLKKLFLDLETEINNLNPPEAGLTKPGSFIFELFAKVHITSESKVELLQLLEKIISHLTTSSTIFHNKAAGLQKFCDIINIMFNKDTPSGSVAEASRCYKVHVRASAPQKKGGRTDLWTSANPAKAKKQGYTLSYWCFSPGFSMKDLVSQGVRSIILTSGTLSPLNSFKSELQIDFPIQLENPHVIGSHQMTVAVMTKGPDGTVLNSSYNTRFNKDYVLSLGNAVVNFSRLVPNGLLVFFPSYPVMNHALELWQESGIQHRITQYKEIFVEPRGKVAFIETIESFYEKINDPKLNGACFFAVCRGKVSEGLDFADINGRAVVITGLPFPPRMDPRVVLKMQYLDEARRRNRSSLSGQDWYRQQASRAVNQAIGRVIRHKEDFGAILLCDTRFSNRDARSQLPSWVRPYVSVYDQFGKGVRDLTNFFKETERTMPKPQPKQAKPSGPVKINQSQCQQQPVASSSSASSAPLTIKAKHIDAHVPSLKRNRDGSHVSEAQLKIMYEDSRPKPAKMGAGLLSALSSVENTPDDTDDGFLSQRSGLTTSQQTGLQRRLDQQKKKKKIVIKQQNGLDSADKTGPPRESEAASKQEPKSKGDNVCLASAQDYLAQVKKTLSRDSYKTFSNIMQKYKESDDFAGMVAGIADLFTEDTSKYPLFRNFYTFARPHHKKQFHAICLSLTGQGCGYKPEHSIRPKKLEKQKPQKPKPSVNSTSNKSKPSHTEQNLQQGLPSCQGAPDGKTGNPTKRCKWDTSDSVSGNALGEQTSELSLDHEPRNQKMPDIYPLAGASVSELQSVCQDPGDPDPKSFQSGSVQDTNPVSHRKRDLKTDSVLAEVKDPESGASLLDSVSKKPPKCMSDHTQKTGTSQELAQKTVLDTSKTTREETLRESSISKTSTTVHSEASRVLETRPSKKQPSEKTVRKNDIIQKRTDVTKVGTLPNDSNNLHDIPNGCSQATVTPHWSDDNPISATKIQLMQQSDMVENQRLNKQEVTQRREEKDRMKPMIMEDGPHPEQGDAAGEGILGGRDNFEVMDEDEEEPMSLETITDEEAVLDASGELFDDSCDPSDLPSGQKDMIVEQQASKECSSLLSKESTETAVTPSSLKEVAQQADSKCSSTEEDTKVASHQESNLLLTQWSKTSRIQKIVNHIKGSITSDGCREDTARTNLKKGNILKRTEAEVEKKGTKSIHDAANRYEYGRAREPVRKEGTSSKSPAYGKTHCSETTLSHVAKKSKSGITRRCDKANSSESTTETDQKCLTPHRKKSSPFCSLKVKHSLPHGEFQSPPKSKVNKSLLDCSQVTLGKELKTGHMTDTLQMRKYPTEKKEELRKVTAKRLGEQQSSLDQRVTAEGNRNEKADGMEAKQSSSPRKKLKKPSRLDSEGRRAGVCQQESTNCPQELASPKPKKVGLKDTGKRSTKRSEELRTDSVDDTQSHETLRKISANPCDTPTKMPHERSHSSTKGKSSQTNQAIKPGDGQWISKNTFMPKAASSSHPKETDRNCGLCKNRAWPAYRGPCGHICCQTCWLEYIREFQECPECGQHAKEKHLIAV